MNRSVGVWEKNAYITLGADFCGIIIGGNITAVAAKTWNTKQQAE